jgi:hypothetical protein
MSRIVIVILIYHRHKPIDLTLMLCFYSFRNLHLVKQNMRRSVWSPLWFLNSQDGVNKSRKKAIPSVNSVI